MPKSILIVDDEPALMRFISHLFKKVGCKVQNANSIYEAKTILSSSPVDAVLSDECLSDGAGTNLVLWIQESFPSILVVMMTGLPCTDLQTLVPVLSKPREILNCVSVITDLFRKKRE